MELGIGKRLRRRSEEGGNVYYWVCRVKRVLLGIHSEEGVLLGVLLVLLVLLGVIRCYWGCYW